MPQIPNPRKIVIASDHAGVALKAAIQKALPEYEWIDLGPADGMKVDYPDYAKKLGEQIAKGAALEGVLICGSGIGMSMAANKLPGIRAAVVENPIAARLSKEHNNANVLCLGARFLAHEYGCDIARAWLETPFSFEPRHEKRIQKIAELERT